MWEPSPTIVLTEAGVFIRASNLMQENFVGKIWKLMFVYKYVNLSFFESLVVNTMKFESVSHQGSVNYLSEKYHLNGE